MRKHQPTKAEVMANLIATFDFIAANPNCTSKDIANHFKIAVPAARSRAISLETRGYITCTNEDVKGYGRVQRHQVITGKHPAENGSLSRVKEAKNHETIDLRRIIVRAKQIGMKPDPFALPRLFFENACI